MASLKSKNSPLSNDLKQLSILNSYSDKVSGLSKFGESLKPVSLFPLIPLNIETLQVNVGKMCNQTCKHCHVDAGPDRTEIMTRETMAQCLAALDSLGANQVDITGGAPEMNPNFRWFVEEIRSRKIKVINRCNLTIIETNAYRDLPEFFARHEVHVISSLPYFDKKRTDSQRGDGVFAKSIEALRRLNAVGYGTRLKLDLVYNPVGAFLPGNQAELEADFKREMRSRFGIEFNSLYAITNMPISRFLEYLIESGNLEDYMEKIVNAFSPKAAEGVMCRSTVSVGWDGFIYDCDFNQMLGINIKDAQGTVVHIGKVDWKNIAARTISVDQHCYGCTAGSGSSCTGSLSK